MKAVTFWGWSVWLAMLLVTASAAQPSDSAISGAWGWAAATPGGRGGQILRVTNLRASGVGSLREALDAEGLRIVVFEVGGVIDLGKSTLSIKNPYVTVAGQTAPSPGITIIKGGIGIQTHDVILQHLRVRPGEAGAAKKSGWEVDAIATGSGAHDVVIDHCSTSWATDENLSASGERFSGATVEEWRKGTSHRVTISHCIIAEGLDHSTHGKGAHSKGSLIHDNATDIAVIANLYASNGQRNPYFKGGARGVVVNNLIDNPGSAAIHYGLQLGEWGLHPWVAGQIAIVGNVLHHGPDTRAGLPLFSTNATPCEVFLDDNLAFDRAGNLARLTSGVFTAKDSPPTWPPGLQSLPANEVKQYVLANAGARPWDRDAVDCRIIQQVRDGKGRIPDSEQEVGGYPNPPETHRAFDASRWDLSTMTSR
jgi:pectate lyase